MLSTMMKLCNKSLTMMKYLKNSNNDEIPEKSQEIFETADYYYYYYDYKVTTRTAEQARG